MGNTNSASSRSLAVLSALPAPLAALIGRGGRRARVALAIVALAIIFKLLRLAGRRGLPRAYFALAAETPRVVFRATPANKALVARCPTLTRRSYCPPWFLFNGHLQTLALSRADEEREPAVAYRRQLLDLPDGGVVSLDWALLEDNSELPIEQAVDASRRTVLVLPGLTGGSPEFYIRKAVVRLRARGWQCVVMNARGCADTPLRTAHLFSSGYTADVRFAARYLRTTYAFETFIGLGFSMGANVLVKFLGEEQEDSPLDAGMSVGNPFDLVKCSANFGATLLHRLTYDKVLTRNLQNLFFERSNAHEMFRSMPGVDIPSVADAKTVREFDDRLTKVAFKYETVDHYYEDASSLRKLERVRVPLLCLNARDDPISVHTALPTVEQVEANPNVILCVTSAGGHLAFYEQAATAVDRADDEPITGSPDESDASTASGSASDKTEVSTPPRMWSAQLITEFADAVWRSRHEGKQQEVGV